MRSIRLRLKAIAAPRGRRSSAGGTNVVLKLLYPVSRRGNVVPVQPNQGLRLHGGESPLQRSPFLDKPSHLC